MLCGIIVAYAAFMLVTKVGCPTRWLFRITCPGCGMSRALLNALMLHFPQAFHYHPLWPLAVVIPIYAFLPKPILGTAKRETLLLYIGIGILVLTYVIRLLLKDPIVTIDLTNGIVYRIFIGG